MRMRHPSVFSVILRPSHTGKEREGRGDGRGGGAMAMASRGAGTFAAVGGGGNRLALPSHAGRQSLRLGNSVPLGCCAPRLPPTIEITVAKICRPSNVRRSPGTKNLVRSVERRAVEGSRSVRQQEDLNGSGESGGGDGVSGESSRGVSVEQESAEIAGIPSESDEAASANSQSAEDIGKALSELRKERVAAGVQDPATTGDFWKGVVEETRLIEWPALPKVLGTTGVVVAMILGSSVVLLTVNAILAQVSDYVFTDPSIKDFARTYLKPFI